jgi:hypothetical protein
MVLLTVQFSPSSCHESGKGKEERGLGLRYERSQSVLNFNWLFTLVLYISQG